MAFFDKVTDKARELADSAKANMKISEEKRRIAELKELAGNLVWKEYSEGAVFSESIAGVCEKIKAAYDSIDALSSELAGRQRAAEGGAAVKCPSCGSELHEGQKFCTNCGAKAPEPEPANVSEKPVCASCGAELPRDSAFCPSCGAKVNAASEDAAAPDAPSEQPPAVRTCASCGAELSDDAAFCSSCGSKC